ncbi:MAG TPA: aldehyde dehydrogenase family protein, partial [Myxococcaceae bacterium]|nr:aldehyde dehydrogenase family protein [Myxococcaceae bacterium]
MILTEKQIEAIVENVVRKLSPELGSQQPPPPVAASQIDESAADGHRQRPQPGSRFRYRPASSGGGSLPATFADLDSATDAAQAAFEVWSETSIETRDKVIEAMRDATRRHAEELARMAVTETGLGNEKDKILKNLLCANR